MRREEKGAPGSPPSGHRLPEIGGDPEREGDCQLRSPRQSANSGGLSRPSGLAPPRPAAAKRKTAENTKKRKEKKRVRLVQVTVQSFNERSVSANKRLDPTDMC